MTRPTPPRPTPARPAAAARNGRTPEPTVDLTRTEGEGAPAMPHERDEKSGMTDGTPSPAMQQGHRDLQRGVEDTSRGTESDAAYRGLKKK